MLCQLWGRRHNWLESQTWATGQEKTQLVGEGSPRGGLVIFHDARLEALCPEAQAVQWPLSPPGALVCAADMWESLCSPHRTPRTLFPSSSCMFVVGGIQKEEPNAEGKMGREQQRSLTS